MEIAQQAVEWLKDSCERIEIAGGVRREKPEPHDVEIVATPRFASLSRPQMTLLDSRGPNSTIVERVNLLDSRIHQLVKEGTFQLGKPNKNGGKAPFGKRVYRIGFLDEQLDVFVVLPPAQWGVVFTMRTGDAEFTHRLMSAGWPSGLHFNQGHLESWMTSGGKAITGGKLPTDIEPKRQVLDTPEEVDVFRLLKMNWVEPKNRSGVGPDGPRTT